VSDPTTVARDALDLDQVQEALDEAGMAVDRVVEVAGLARASEARQVGGEAAAAAQELQPVVAAGGNAVQVQGG